MAPGLSPRPEKREELYSRQSSWSEIRRATNMASGIDESLTKCGKQVSNSARLTASPGTRSVSPSCSGDYEDLALSYISVFPVTSFRKPSESKTKPELKTLPKREKKGEKNSQSTTPLIERKMFNLPLKSTHHLLPAWLASLTW